MNKNLPRFSILLHFWAYSAMLSIWKSGKTGLIHISGVKLCGKAMEKKLSKWGKEENFELSPISMSCPQSYPQGFPRALQRVIRQSTDSTTITTLINIY